jgi:CrcB protein
VIGYFVMLSLPHGPHPVSPDLRLFVIAGLCGGYTTFSSFSFQTLELLRGGEFLLALTCILAPVVLCLVLASTASIGAAQTGFLISGGRP